MIKRLIEKYKIQLALCGMIILIALAACSTNMAIGETFQQSVDQYNKLLSEQEFDTARLFASETLAEEFRVRAKAAKNIKVIDYHIVKARYEESKGVAEVEVEIEYYSLSSYRAKTLIDVQKWAYVIDKGTSQWKLMSLLPEFP